jgi:spore coat polysaccharide biosynthesis protein SpsF
VSEQQRILAIVQVRMSSPGGGNALAPLAGKPRLWHAVRKLRHSKLIHCIAIATSVSSDDEPIVTFANENGVYVVRSAEDDALSCFARTAEAFDANFLVRVSESVPEPSYIDHLLEALIAEGGDYVLPADDGATYRETAEAFSRRALDRLMMDARTDLLARREVTAYFRAHPGFVRMVRAPAWLPRVHELAIDAPAFGEAMATHETRDREGSLSDLIALLDRTSRTGHGAPRIARVGAAVICCDGGGQSGNGRAKRMIALAQSLRDAQGIVSRFAVSGPDETLALIRRAGFDATRLVPQDDGAAIPAMIAANDAQLLVVDCREGPSLPGLRRAQRGAALTAVIDDVSHRRLAADVAYYPPLPGVERLDWRGSHTVARIGWRWMPLAATTTASRRRAPSQRPTLLVTMGNNNPAGPTLKVARALALLPSVFRARFAIGSGVAGSEAVARAIVALKSGFETVEGADDLATEYASADIALTVFGLAAYELAACGVPAIYLALSEEAALAASAFEQAGMGISLGLAGNASDEAIAGAVRQLLSDPARRRDMRASALMTIDANGASRIAADLAQLLRERLSIPERASFA